MKEKEIPFLRRKLGVVFQDFKLLNDRNVKKHLNFLEENNNVLPLQELY